MPKRQPSAAAHATMPQAVCDGIRQWAETLEADDRCPAETWLWMAQRIGVAGLVIVEDVYRARRELARGKLQDMPASWVGCRRCNDSTIDHEARGGKK